MPERLDASPFRIRPGTDMDRGLENLSVSFQARPRGYASYYVYRFANPFHASLGYDALERGGPTFPKQEVPLTGWTYRSLLADESRLSCAAGDGYQTMSWCVAMARYQSYAFVLVTNLSPDALTTSDLERLLRLIDERVERKLRGAGQSQ